MLQVAFGRCSIFNIVVLLFCIALLRPPSPKVTGWSAPVLAGFTATVAKFVFVNATGCTELKGLIIQLAHRFQHISHISSRVE